MKRFLCKVFGHQYGTAFVGRRSDWNQTPWPDQIWVSCERCGQILTAMYTYEPQTLAQVAEFTASPQPQEKPDEP